MYTEKFPNYGSVRLFECMTLNFKSDGTLLHK
jgi:hypothetical protein